MFAGTPRVGVLPDGGKLVDVNVMAIVGGIVAVISVGVVDGVLVSAKNAVGMADPTIGIEIKNE